MATRRRDRFHARRGILARGSKGRRILLWVLIGACTCAVLLIIAYYQLLAHLQSPAFCRTLSKHAGNALQAEYVSLRDALQIEGNRISLGEAIAENISIIDGVAAQGISMEIDRGALWNRHLAMRKLAIEEASIFITLGQTNSAPATAPLPNKTESKTTPMPEEQEAGDAPPEPVADSRESTGSSSGSFISNFTPNQFTLDYFECKDSDAHLLLNGREYSLRACTISALPQKKLGRNTWQINLENGRFHTPFVYLRDTSVKNATIIASPKEINLIESCLLLTPGELRVRGTYNNNTQRWSTVLRANKANVARILSEDWKKRLHGELYGELELTGKSNNLTRGAGYISLQKGMLEGLPILSQIQMGDTRPYRSLPLEKAECRLSFPYNDPRLNIRNAWLFDRIDIRAHHNLLFVQGHVIIGPDTSLGGTLRIGLPAGRFNTPAISILSKLFEQEDEQGIMWLRLNLSGTLDDPQEDLSIRIATIVRQALPQISGNAAQGVSNIINCLFNRPQKQEEQPKEAAQEQSQSPLDGAGNLLKNTLQNLF